MRFTASDIAAATKGRVVGPDTVCVGASIDTRTIEEGQLFVPIVGERDGHDFIGIALAAGAAAYLTDRPPSDDHVGTAIVVDDTRIALTEIGRVARARHDGPVIGITGSVGKTSVKDLTIAAIGGTRRAHSSEKSFNNELGVPLTLVNAPGGTEILIVEMGSRGVGHIKELCAVALPTIGIVTWVGAVHTSEFGSIEAVAEAKGELIECLPDTGTAILNADCDPVRLMSRQTAARVITYGETGDVVALDITTDVELRPSFQVVSFGRSFPASLAVHGVHQVSNALAALAAAEAVGVAPEDAIAGIATASLSPWRMELHRTPTGATVVNDAYNANVISSSAALHSLAALPAERRVAVLGVMAELGDRHDADHQEIAALCDELEIELIAFKEPAYGVVPFVDFDQIIDRLGPLRRTDAVLIKGSRVAELEQLVERLL